MNYLHQQQNRCHFRIVTMLIVLLSFVQYGCRKPLYFKPKFSFANYSMRFEDSSVVSNCIETITIASTNSNEDTIYVWVGHIGDKAPVTGVGKYHFKDYFFTGSEPITKLRDDSLAIPPHETVSIQFSRSQFGVRDSLRAVADDDTVLFNGALLIRTR